MCVLGVIKDAAWPTCQTSLFSFAIKDNDASLFTQPISAGITSLSLVVIKIE